MRASELIGTTAVDRQGEALGRIKDLIVSAQTGHVHYALVAFSGWLGLGDKHYIYPVNALAPGRSRDEVAIQVDSKDLGERTGVDELESWLRKYDPNAAFADRRFVPASKLLGKPVEDHGGNRAGELEDIVLNLGSGDVRYVIVELEPSRKSAEPRLALPLHALAVPILRDEALRLKTSALGARELPRR